MRRKRLTKPCSFRKMGSVVDRANGYYAHNHSEVVMLPVPYSIDPSRAV
jgi:hypothetical protein